MGDLNNNPLLNNNKIIRPSVDSNGRNGSQGAVPALKSTGKLQAIIDANIQKPNLQVGDIFDVAKALLLLRDSGGDPKLPNSPFNIALLKLALLPVEDKTSIQNAYKLVSQDKATLTLPEEKAALNNLPEGVRTQLFSQVPVETLLKNLKSTNTSGAKQELILKELLKRDAIPNAITPEEKRQLGEILNPPQPAATPQPVVDNQAKIAEQRAALTLTPEQRRGIPLHLGRYAERDTETLLKNISTPRDPATESLNKALNRQVYSFNELTQRAAQGKLNPAELGRLEEAKQFIQKQDSASVQLFKDRFNVIRLFNTPEQARTYDEALIVKPPASQAVANTTGQTTKPYAERAKQYGIDSTLEPGTLQATLKNENPQHKPEINEQKVFAYLELLQRAADGKISTARLDIGADAIRKNPEVLKAFQTLFPGKTQAEFDILLNAGVGGIAVNLEAAKSVFAGLQQTSSSPVSSALLGEIQAERSSQSLVEALQVVRPRPGETPEQQALRKAVILNEVAQRVQEKRVGPERLEEAKAALKALPPEQAQAIQQSVVATFPNTALAQEFSVAPAKASPTTAANPNVLPHLLSAFRRLSPQQLFSNLTTRTTEQSSPRIIQEINDGHAYAVNELARRLRLPEGDPQRLTREEEEKFRVILFNMPDQDKGLLLSRFTDFNTGLATLGEIANADFSINPQSNNTAAATVVAQEPIKSTVNNQIANNQAKPTETPQTTAPSVDPAAEAARQQALQAAKRKARVAYVNKMANQLAEQLIAKDLSNMTFLPEAQTAMAKMNMTANEKQKALQIIRTRMQRAEALNQEALQVANQMIKDGTTSLTASAQINDIVSKSNMSKNEKEKVSKVIKERIERSESQQQEEKKRLAQESAEQQKQNQVLETEKQVALNNQINQTPKEGSANNRFF